MADVNDVGGNSSFDWSGALNAFGEIGSAAINAGSSKKSQQRARKYDEELMRIQDELNDSNALDAFNRSMEAWNLQNEYNSPLSQRERLENAGLNAALLYGSMSGGAVGTAGGLSPSPSSSVGVGSVGTVQPIPFGNIGRAIAEIDLMKSQANKNDAEAEDLRGETKPSQARMDVATQTAALLKEQVIGQRQANDIDAFMNELKKQWEPSNWELNNRNLTRRTEIAFEELVAARNENSLYPKRVQQLNATIDNILQDTLTKRADEMLKRVKAANEKYQWQQILPLMREKISEEINVIKEKVEQSGYETTLLENAVRDYDANWWNATIQGWLGSIMSGGQAAASLYSSTFNGK